MWNVQYICQLNNTPLKFLFIKYFVDGAVSSILVGYDHGTPHRTCVACRRGCEETDFSYLKEQSYSMLQLFYNRYSNAVYINTDIGIYLLVIMMLIIMFFDSHVRGSSVKNTKVLWHVKYLGQDYSVKRSVMWIHLLQQWRWITQVCTIA